MIKLLVATFILFWSSAAFAGSCYFGNHQSDKDIFTLDDLSIEVNLNYRKYVKNIFQILSTDGFIEQNLKKYRKASLQISANGYECEADAKVRFTGDFNDHVDRKALISSLKIKLKQKSISNVVNFKILNPESRFGLHELMLTAFLRQLGVVSPRTTFAWVSVGKSRKLMLLQEDMSKEMLEYNKRREDFIIKGSETIGNVLIGGGMPDSNHLSFEIDNKKYVDKNHRHLSALNAARALNNLKLTHSFPLLQSMESPGLEDIPLYYLILVATEAGHAAAFFNTHLYYDSALEKYVPIYYDGNVRLFEFGQRYFISENEYESVILGAGVETFKRVISTIDSISDGLLKIPEYEQIKRYQASITADWGDKYSGQDSYLVAQFKDKQLVKKFLGKLRSNLMKMLEDRRKLGQSPDKPDNKSPNEIYRVEKPKSDSKLVYADWSIDEFSKVSNDATCSMPELFELCEALRGGINVQRALASRADSRESLSPATIYAINGNPVLPVPLSNFFDIGDGNFLEIVNFHPDNDLVLVAANKLTVRCSFECQLIIKDAALKDFEIDVEFTPLGKSYGHTKARPPVNKSRNLTGGINIIDSRLSGVSIKVKHSKWEDAFNCVRCTGQISSIEVINSVSDGFDADFSDLEMEYIRVQKSGNDCVDVSAGQYSINTLIADECGDKAISIGEASSMRLSTLSARTAKIGIAIKDSSTLYLKQDYKEKFNFSRVDLDFATYNKKQEYGTGRTIETP